jgi:IS5 family transposase
VFEGVAQRGKTSTGWFFGFKVHLIVNDMGEMVAFAITPANVDDRKPVPRLTADLVGKLFGDKGYLSQKLFAELLERGLELITSIRKNMQPRLLSLMDKLLLRKRALIESVNDQLKNISQIEHTRHRSFKNFFVNLLAGLIAYTLQPKKPSLKFEAHEMSLLSVF